MPEWKLDPAAVRKTARAVPGCVEDSSLEGDTDWTAKIPPISPESMSIQSREQLVLVECLKDEFEKFSSVMCRPLVH